MRKTMNTNNKFKHIYGSILGIILNVLAFSIIIYGLFICKDGSGCLAISLLPFIPIFAIFGLTRGPLLMVLVFFFYFTMGYLIVYLIYLIKRKRR